MQTVSEPNRYVGKFVDVFGDLTDLNYYNACTQEFIRDVCFYWMDEFKSVFRLLGWVGLVGSAAVLARFSPEVLTSLSKSFTLIS